MPTGPLTLEQLRRLLNQRGYTQPVTQPLLDRINTILANRANQVPPQPQPNVQPTPAVPSIDVPTTTTTMTTKKRSRHLTRHQRRSSSRTNRGNNVYKHSERSPYNNNRRSNREERRELEKSFIQEKIFIVNVLKGCIREWDIEKSCPN